MKNFALIVFSLFIALSSHFHIIVEDTATNRKGTIFGKVQIIHHERDNKPAFIMMEPYLQHNDGQPPLTVAEVDIMHLLSDGLYRFQPELMQPQFEKNTHYLHLLKYRSKKNQNFTYRFYFQQSLHEQMKEIKDFVELHQLEPHVDLFSQLPEDMKQQLIDEHYQSIKISHHVQNTDQL